MKNETILLLVTVSSIATGAILFYIYKRKEIKEEKKVHFDNKSDDETEDTPQVVEASV